MALKSAVPWVTSFFSQGTRLEKLGYQTLFQHIQVQQTPRLNLRLIPVPIRIFNFLTSRPRHYDYKLRLPLREVVRAIKQRRQKTSRHPHLCPKSRRKNRRVPRPTTDSQRSAVHDRHPYVTYSMPLSMRY